MADNTTQDGTAIVAADEVPYSSDTTKVQIVQLAWVTGAEGSRTLAKLAGDETDGLLVNPKKKAQTPASPTAASVGTTSGTAVAANANRTGLVLVNTSNNTISLGFADTAVLNSGITLVGPGGSFTMDAFTFTVGAITAIASVAGSNLAIQEFS